MKQLSGLEVLFRSQAQEKELELRFENDYGRNRPLRAGILRLNQVLINIIGNAIKFTDKGGVTVRVEELEIDPKVLLRFSVADTGIGIEPAARSHIFNDFEQASVFYFTLSFEYAEEEAPGTAVPEEPEVLPDFHGNNILLAEDTKKSMDSGINGHLSKPIQVEQLLQLLGECIRRNE